MRKVLPSTLYGEDDFEDFWQFNARLIENPLCASLAQDSKMHYAGGPPIHPQSNCPECKRKLTMLWNLDLGDPLIPNYIRSGFSPAKRLPLYVCLQCVAASYKLLSETKIKIFPFDHHVDAQAADETPFLNSPLELQKRGLKLTPIPSTIDALLSLADDLSFECLDQQALVILSQYFGVEVESRHDIEPSQLGVHFLPAQGHIEVPCPNPQCPASRLEYPYANPAHKAFLMRELALIQGKIEPILGEHYFQLLYHVCINCFSIRAEYVCS